MQMLRIKDLCEMFGVSRQTIVRWRKDPSFPRGRQLSRQTVAFVESEIREWVRTRKAA